MKRVLIVDDLATNRLILRELLEPFDCACIEVENGLQGLAAVKENPPDLILTDYEMPAMNGLEFLSTLKNEPSTSMIPVVLITALSTNEIMRQALELGAETVLPKPFEFEALFKAVGSITDTNLFEPHDLVSSIRTMEILLVEDNEGDVRLTKEALKELDVQAHLSVVNDGEEALAFLHHDHVYADSLRPDLILLDLNLPKKSGHEVLAEIKADKEFQTIPVVVLSTSAQEEDVLRAHDQFANCYVTKPSDLNEFLSVIKNITTFWLVVAKVPSSPK